MISTLEIICTFYKIRKYDILILVNGCGQCPQYVHVREILIVLVIS